MQSPVVQSLTKLLANVTLKFLSWNTANTLIFFAEKNVSCFCIAKATSGKYIHSPILLWAPIIVSPFNPLVPKRLFYLQSLDRSIFNIRGVWLVFINTLFSRNSYIWCKQCSPWSDAAFCDVWSVSTLFAIVPLWDARLKWVNSIKLLSFFINL